MSDGLGTVERAESEPTADTVRLSITNPEAVVIDDGDAVWAVASIPDPGVRPAIESGADFEEIRALLMDSPGEYSLVQVSTADGLTIRAHRGITSAYDVYFGRTSSGEVIVTDLFRNALSRLAVDDRTVTEAIVADHLLYRTTPTGSYVREIDRLGHGETLEWDPTDGTCERTLVETLDAGGDSTASEGPGRLETALERATAYTDEDIVSMLSGGIDSTLLHTFLPDDTPSMSAAFEAPEFEFEREYAERASTLLGTEHHFQVEDETSFLRYLEETIDAIGMPPQQLQSPTMDLAFRMPEQDTFVHGFYCDALYGMGARRARLVWLTRALGHLPAVNDTLETHRRIVKQLRRSPWDPRSLAQQFSQYLPQDYVAEFVGADTVERRQLARVEYVRPRVSLADDGGSFGTHMDWGHWIEYFCENSINDFRQIAQARGKSMRAPFASTAVAEAALSVPSPDRYIERLREKHIPKRLLARRLPSYDTDKPKGNGNLPIGRYLRDGPLVDALERYSLPAFTPASDWESIVDAYPGMGWILLSWAIWRDRVLRDPEVSEAPGTRAVDVST